MKTLFTSIFALLTATSIYALPVGNPSEANLLWEGIFINHPFQLGVGLIILV